MTVFSGPGRWILSVTNTCVNFSEALLLGPCDYKLHPTLGTMPSVPLAFAPPIPHMVLFGRSHSASKLVSFLLNPHLVYRKQTLTHPLSL